MSTTVGVYSSLNSSTSSVVLERLLSSTLTPLLQSLYRDINKNIVLCLSGFEMEWIESNHPEINVLINTLTKRGQISFLATSYNGLCLSLIPTTERSSEIEKTAAFIRKRYQKKPLGFWAFMQAFNPIMVNTMSLLGLEYIVTSTSNKNSRAVKEPFIMSEMGKACTVIPTNDDFSKIIHEGFINHKDTFSLVSEIQKVKINRSKMVDFVMINLDQLLYPQVDGLKVIKSIIDYIQSKGINLNLFDIKELHKNEVLKTGYLNSGIYGYDIDYDISNEIEPILKDTCFKNYYYLLESLKAYTLINCKDEKSIKKLVPSIIIKSLGANLRPLLTNSDPSLINFDKGVLELVNALKAFSINLPNYLDVDFDGYNEFLYFSKSSLIVLDSKGGAINGFYGGKTANFSILSRRYPILSSSIITSNKRHINLNNVRFELSGSPDCVSMKLENYNKDGLSFNFVKEFSFSENSIILSLKLTNLQQKALEGKFSLYLPASLSLKDKGSYPKKTTSSCFEISENSFINVNSLNSPYTLEFEDIDKTYRTELVENNKYLYTNYCFIWELQVTQNSSFEQVLMFTLT